MMCPDGHPRRKGARFCFKCGYPLNGWKIRGITKAILTGLLIGSLIGLGFALELVILFR